MPNISTVKATINGQEYDLALNTSTGKYEAVITAPAKSSYPINDKHYYNVQIAAQDTAGNQTVADASDTKLGDSLKLVVKEKIAPVITIKSPTSGATLITNKPTITIEVTDNDSGVDTSTFKLVIDNGTEIAWQDGTATAITGGYNWTYTPATALADGSHTIKADVSDNDGNAAVQKSATIKVDTVPPTLNISEPADGLWTNVKSGTVSGVTNDETSSPVTIVITVNGADQGAVTVAGDGNFSHNVTYTEGTNVVVVKATDSAGKESVVERTVNVNTVAPVIKSVTITPNPVSAGSTYTISVEVE